MKMFTANLAGGQQCKVFISATTKHVLEELVTWQLENMHLKVVKCEWIIANSAVMLRAYYHHRPYAQ